MDLKKNILLVAGVGSCAVLLLVVLVFLFRASTELNEQKRELKRQYRRISQLHTRATYPSAENVEALELNHDELAFRVDDLASVLSRDPFPREAVEAAGFSARVQNVIERFRKRAERAGVALPANLEVGFSRYASGGSVPIAEHVPRLSRQLYSVERVVDVLVRSGVHSVKSLTRDVFEEAGVARPEPGQQRRRGRREVPATSAQDSSGLQATAAHPGGLYYIERIGVGFTAREDVVWRVLDRFASAPHFMVVAEFSHTSNTQILSYNPDAVTRGEASDDETLRFLSEGILTGSKALSRPERIIAGDELVRVMLKVDVYNFTPPVEEGVAP
jgi:hypothetical protein